MCQVVDDVALLRTPSCGGRACPWHSDLGLRRKGLNYLCSKATQVSTRSTHESQVQSYRDVWASSRGSKECHWMGWFIWTNSGRNLVTPDAGFSSFSSILLFQSAQTALFFHAWHLKSICSVYWQQVQMIRKISWNGIFPPVNSICYFSNTLEAKMWFGPFLSLLLSFSLKLTKPGCSCELTG